MSGYPTTGRPNASPLVTVGLPAFKARFFRAALESILQQTYRNIEVVIVNDASPEDITGIVAGFTDPRIRYSVNAENLGRTSVVRNWNRVLELAAGEYFILASDDDLYAPDYVERLVALAERYPHCHLFHGRSRIIDEQDTVITFAPSCPERESGIDFVWHRMTKSRIHMAPDFMSRTAVLKAAGGFVDFPLAWASDDATWFLVAREGGVAYDGEAVFQWRKSGLNLTNAFPLEPALRSSQEFAHWYVVFQASLEARTEQDRLLLKELRAKSMARFEVLKGTTMVNFWGPNATVFSVVGCLIYWLRHRRRLEISANAFGLAMVHILKTALRNLFRPFLRSSP